MRNESRDPLDALIDRASQALVSGEPGSSLRAGVRERIGSRPSWAAVPAWGAVAAVLALAVLTRVLMGGPDAPTRAGRQTPAAVPSRPLAAPPAAGLEREAGETEFRSVAAVPGRRVAPAEMEMPTVELEPLIPPIEIEPLVTNQIAVFDGSAAMPIEIEPLEIELIDVAQLPTSNSQRPTSEESGEI